MSLGALLLSLTVVLFGPGVLLEQARLLPTGSNIGISFLFLVSTGLVLGCDVALVMEAVRSKGNQWVRGSLDWVVWIAAIALTAGCVWVNMIWTHGDALLAGRLDTLYRVGFDAVLLFFDVAIIMHAVKTRRTESVPL
jgi:hypothetical protein